MVVSKTEWLSLRLHSETIYSLVSRLNISQGDIGLESQLALELESELISMRILTQLLRGVILSRPEETMVPELHT